MIFSKPALQSKTVTVGDQDVVLYVFPGDLWVNHVLTAEGIEAYSKANNTNPEEELSQVSEDDIQVDQFLTGLRDDWEYKHTVVACSLAPGYPDMGVPAIIAELKLNVCREQLEDLYREALALNGVVSPKPEVRTGSSSTD
ncbi:MAG: hypothetical protein OIF55_14680 [Amphritea sp.]|nr:hypothetical protein [Amphritea sp.]